MIFIQFKSFISFYLATWSITGNWIVTIGDMRFRVVDLASLIISIVALVLLSILLRRTTIGLALRAVFGRLREDKDFLALASNEVKIQARRKRLRVAFDGEIDLLETPLHYRVRTRALRVIVPKDTAAKMMEEHANNSSSV